MIREVSIISLQPTDTELNLDALEFYSKYPIRYNRLPEIWEIENEHLIADGHNQLYDRYQNGNRTALVNIFNSESCVSSSISLIIQEILKEKAKNAKNKGIKNIMDLKIS